MSITPKTGKATAANAADADPSAVFGGTAAEATKRTQTKRNPLPRPTHSYTFPSQPKMQWLRSGEIPHKPDTLNDGLGDIAALSPEDLEQDVFLCGVPLLELLHLVAGSYQVTTPWAVLVNALCVAALDNPLAKVNTGIDSLAHPLNLLFAVTAPSGRGKGSAFRAPIKMAYDGTIPTRRTPASGEMLIRMFYELVDIQVDGGKQKTEWVRREDGLWVEWDETDHKTAKGGNAGAKGGTNRGAGSSTLDPLLRTLFIGSKAGDEALSRDSSCAVLEPGSYRFVATMQGTDDRMGVILQDETGGTLQRTIFLSGALEDNGDMPTLEELEERQALLCKRLGIPGVVDECPSLSVWGLHGKITVTDEVRRILKQRRIWNSYGKLPDVEGHYDAVRIRLAAIFAGWVAGYGNDAIVDDTAWWWAGCVMDMSRRVRERLQDIYKRAGVKEQRDAGVLDAERQDARNAALEKFERAQAEAVKDRVLDAVQSIVGASLWCNVRRADPSKGATSGEIKRGLSKKQQRYVDGALQLLVDEGRIAAVPDGIGFRYLPTADANNYAGS